MLGPSGLQVHIFCRRPTQTIVATTCRHNGCRALRASTKQIRFFVIAKEAFVRSGLPAIAIAQAKRAGRPDKNSLRPSAPAP
jgi:hypothetical protein